jgi:NADH dehydrogenase FAD-containing subunit
MNIEGSQYEYNNKRLVILGAGYGGIFLAINIARSIREKTVEVILVSYSKKRS